METALDMAFYLADAALPFPVNKVSLNLISLVPQALTRPASLGCCSDSMK